jgi:EF hand
LKSTNSTSEINAGGDAALQTFASDNYEEQQGNQTFSSFESGQENGHGSKRVSHENIHSIQGNIHESGHETFSTSNDEEVDPALLAFKTADINKDGIIDPDEFRQFLVQNFRTYFS